MPISKAKAALWGLAFGVLSIAAQDRAAAHDSSGAAPPDGVTVAGMDVYEDCRKLEPGEVMTYSFEASQAMDFNIHFHDAGLVYTPVELSGVTAHAGEFQAETAQSYCLMWTSLGIEDTLLHYQVH